MSLRTARRQRRLLCILGGVLLFLFPIVARAQSGCTNNTLTAPVQKVEPVPSLEATTFGVRLGSSVSVRLATVLSDEFFKANEFGSMDLHKPTHNFSCSYLVYTVIELRRGFYVIIYVAPDAEHDAELLRYKALLSTFHPLTDGPSGNPLQIAAQPPPSGTSECSSPQQDFQIACPPDWVMTKDEEGDHFLQVNWSPRNDPTTALHVIWFSYSVPHRLKDGSLELYSSADDFTRQTLQDVFGFSEFTANPGAVSSQDPREQLTQLVAMFQKTPDDETLHEKILEVATKIDPRPAYPAEAQQHFAAGAALMQTKQAALAQQAVTEFQKAVTLAPWWPEAYYDLSSALEVTSKYDDAIQQLQYYLQLKPSVTDAADAQGRIIALRAEKESAARSAEQHQGELALMYVNGGAQRFRVADAPASWNPPDRIGSAELYGYSLPEEQPYFANIFRMPNGRTLAIALEPEYGNCRSGGFCDYTGDGIVVVDVTRDPCSTGNFNRPFHYGELAQQTDIICGYQYMVSVTNQPKAIVSVTLGQAGIALPVAMLYRARAFAAYSVDRPLVQIAWSQTDGRAIPVELGFSEDIRKAAQNTTVNPLSLVPSYVKFH